MLVGFVGDVHGCVFDAFAAVASLQLHLDRQLDFIVQVGDMGAFPDVSQVDASTAAYLAVDPRQADFARLLRSDPDLSRAARRLRAEFSTAMHFLRGNHEDFEWLKSLEVDPASATARVDASDLLRYVPDGRVLDVSGVRVGFLGGVEEQTGAPGIDRKRYDELLELGPGAIDVLVTHQGPHGSSTGYRGDVQGSAMITALVERLKPPFHVAGHAHQLIGPRSYGSTTYLGLHALVPSRRWQPDARGLNPGCLAVLDTARQSLDPITDDWLTAFDTPFEFESWVERH